MKTTQLIFLIFFLSSMTQNIPKLHNVRLGQNTLHSPSSQLAAVVLHLSSHNGTALSDQLASPVESTTAALGLAVELVQRTDGNVLILAAGSALLDGIHLGTDNQVHGVLVVGGQVKSSVLVGLAGGGVGVLGSVVEGVGVAHIHLGGLTLADDLVGKVVVDVGGFLGQGRRHVDTLFATIGGIQRSIRGVLVDSHHIQIGIVALVKEDLVALAHDDNIPGVDGARRAHEHGQDAVGGEDGGLVLFGELLDDGIRRGGHVVSSAVNGRELLLRTLDGLLVERPIVVVQETVVSQILALIGFQVQFGQTIEVNFLQQLPVGLDVDTGVAVASRLVVILPAKAATTPRTSIRSTASVIASALSRTASSLELAASSTAGITTASTLAAATSRENGASAVSRLRRVSGVADDGKARLIFGGRRAECGSKAGTVCLLIYRKLSTSIERRERYPPANDALLSTHRQHQEQNVPL